MFASGETSFPVIALTCPTSELSHQHTGGHRPKRPPPRLGAVFDCVNQPAACPPNVSARHRFLPSVADRCFQGS